MSYLAVFIILFGIFETGIRLVVSSIASQHKIELALVTDQEDDDATKERERINERVAKEYIVEYAKHLFLLPECNLKITLAKYVGNFSYQFYSEVLTPPPNC
ncbi:hypothetical protein [Mucilaginibacter puniceus]